MFTPSNNLLVLGLTPDARDVEVAHAWEHLEGMNLVALTF